MYATKPQLVALVKDYQTTGRMPEELVTILDKIITGVAGRFRYWGDDMDDRRQEYFLLVMRKFRNIDTEKNIFSYLTRCAMNVLHLHHRSSERYKQLKNDFQRDSSHRRERL
jgi:DNA-directed RNA polymerase specialized sigma24 family protein